MASSAKADGSRSNVWKHFEKVKDLPIFMQGTSASMFTIKLSERLSDHPLIEYYACYEPGNVFTSRE